MKWGQVWYCTYDTFWRGESYGGWLSYDFRVLERDGFYERPRVFHKIMYDTFWRGESYGFWLLYNFRVLKRDGFYKRPRVFHKNNTSVQGIHTKKTSVR